MPGSFMRSFAIARPELRTTCPGTSDCILAGAHAGFLPRISSMITCSANVRQAHTSPGSRPGGSWARDMSSVHVPTEGRGASSTIRAFGWSW
ncbi:hypothetical protein [Nannocystis pusilla]|uniref:hypothetical protein n=1 Tax=Nannocystis pusilla TaxID=889268 RepID=UPI003DA414A5